MWPFKPLDTRISVFMLQAIQGNINKNSISLHIQGSVEYVHYTNS